MKLLCIVFPLLALPLSAQEFSLPQNSDERDYTPAAQIWFEPEAIQLSDRPAPHTVLVRDRQYHLKQTVSKETSGQAGAHFEDAETALHFRSESNTGRSAPERLVIDNCTFLIDFQRGNLEDWNPLRSAIHVEGYGEVLIRNCAFAVVSKDSDPIRKTIASIYATDCLKVQIEDCHFQGRTLGFRGHLTLFGCGPTSIRNCEIDGLGGMAGGIWVATGVGEGKIGWPHQKDPSKMIYPAGPVLIENCHVHHQKSKQNSDGIYLQSVGPYLIRNTKFDSWGPDDSLLDVGFRDSASRSYGGKPMTNHGRLGMVERCEFSNGWLKSTVGLGGGLIFRQNKLSNAWIFPYFFDGGSWYLLGNEWEDMDRVAISGRMNQTDGWTPKEGLAANSSKFFIYNNRFGKTKGKLDAVYVGGAAPGPLADVIVADFNHYAFDDPKAWALASQGEEPKNFPTFENWRKSTGNDRNSVLGRGSRRDFTGARLPFELPGGIPMEFGELESGLTGPVGLADPSAIRLADGLRKTAESQH